MFMRMDGCDKITDRKRQKHGFLDENIYVAVHERQNTTYVCRIIPISQEVRRHHINRAENVRTSQAKSQQAKFSCSASAFGHRHSITTVRRRNMSKL